MDTNLPETKDVQNSLRQIEPDEFQGLTVEEAQSKLFDKCLSLELATKPLQANDIRPGQFSVYICLWAFLTSLMATFRPEFFLHTFDVEHSVSVEAMQTIAACAAVIFTYLGIYLQKSFILKRKHFLETQMVLDKSRALRRLAEELTKEKVDAPSLDIKEGY